MTSFLKKIFGGEDTDVDFDDFDKPMAQTPAVSTDTDSRPTGNFDPVMLDAILNIINSNLPPIAAQCIDKAAQRLYLESALGQAYADMAERLRAKAVGELTGDRKKMQSELDALRVERKEFNAKRDEQKAALLSEQRQRRALSDRNRDLEAKIDELDSQIEQHKLTIASMTNKLRVAEVSETDGSVLRQEMETLQKQLAEKDETIGRLQAELNTAKDAAAAAPAPAESEPRKTRKTRKPRQQYVPSDDDATANLDSLDWLLPGGAPAGHVGHVPDPEFGYQPPKQAPTPESDAQLTLF